MDESYPIEATPAATPPTPTIREYRIECRYTGDSAWRDDAMYFLAGMVAATYGPVDYSYADDDDDAAFMIEAVGTKPPSAKHLLHWREIARRTLPALLVDAGELEIGEPKLAEWDGAR